MSSAGVDHCLLLCVERNQVCWKGKFSLFTDNRGISVKREMGPLQDRVMMKF